MANIERLIFEHSMLALEMHNFLGKVDFDKKSVPSGVIDNAKKVFETILQSENCEIAKNLGVETDCVDEPKQKNVYEHYLKFYSEYLNNPVAKKGVISQNRVELYNNVFDSVYASINELTNLLNQYTGNDNNLLNLGQYAVMCLKGRVANSTLVVLKKEINVKADFFTSIPKTFGDFVCSLQALLDCSVVKRNNDLTCVNTIYGLDELEQVVGMFKSALLTEKEAKNINNREAYSIYTPHNTWVHTDKFGFKYVNKFYNTGFAETLKEKQNITTTKLPALIKEQREKVFETLKGSYEDAKFFAQNLFETFGYTSYYTSNVAEQVEEKEVENAKTEKPETIKPQKEHKHIDFKKGFSELGSSLATAFTGVGWFFKKVGLMFKNIGVGIWKALLWILKIIAFPFVALFKLVRKNPVVGIVLGLVIVATPITCYFVFKKPCCYDYGKVVAESTCTTHGKAEYKCLVHNKTKTVELPLKHNVLNNVCSGCGKTIASNIEAYSQNETSGTTYYVDAKFVNGKYEWYDHDVVICPTAEDGVVDKVVLGRVLAKNAEIYLPNTVNEFKGLEAEFKNLTIYVGNNGTVLDFEDCEVKNLSVVGNVKEIKNLNNVDKIVAYGHVTTLTVEDYTKLDRFVATGGVSAINTNNLGKTLFLSNEMSVDFNIDENEDLQNIFVDENHPSLKSVDGVVYTKNLSQLVCYPKNKREKTLVLPKELKSDENFVIKLKNAKNLRTIKYPDGLKCVHLNFDDSTKIKNVEIGTGVKEVYLGLVKHLEKVSFAESNLTFECYKRNNGVFTEKQEQNFVTKGAKENVEFLKGLGFVCKFEKV